MAAKRKTTKTPARKSAKASTSKARSSAKAPANKRRASPKAKRSTKAPARKAAPARKSAPAKKSAPKKSTRKTSAAAALKRKAAPLKARRPKVPAAKRPPRAAKQSVQRPVVENSQALELARTIASAAAEKKGENVLIIDTRAKGSLVGYDYIVLASGESDRQIEAMADAVDDVVRPKGKRPFSVERSPDWVAVAYDDVMAHFFTPDKRGDYDFETLWKDAPRIALR